MKDRPDCFGGRVGTAGMARKALARHGDERSARPDLARQAGIGTESMLQARIDAVRMLVDWSGRQGESASVTDGAL